MSRATQYLAYLNGNYTPAQITHYFTDLTITESMKKTRRLYKNMLKEKKKMELIGQLINAIIKTRN